MSLLSVLSLSSILLHASFLSCLVGFAGQFPIEFSFESLLSVLSLSSILLHASFLSCLVGFAGQFPIEFSFESLK